MINHRVLSLSGLLLFLLLAGCSGVIITEEYNLNTEKTGWRVIEKYPFFWYQHQAGNTVFETYPEDAGRSRVKVGPPYIFPLKEGEVNDTLAYKFRFDLKVNSTSDSVVVNVNQVSARLSKDDTLSRYIVRVSISDSSYRQVDVGQTDTLQVVHPFEWKRFYFSLDIPYSEAKEVTITFNDISANGGPIRVPPMRFKRRGRTQMVPLPRFLWPTH